MMKKEKIREKIIKKIEKASGSDLDRINNYIQVLAEREKRRSEILSFSGSWKEMPKNLFSSLTVQLHNKRKSRRNIME
jgi:hypothetical protein